MVSSVLSAHTCTVCADSLDTHVATQAHARTHTHTHTRTHTQTHTHTKFVCELVCETKYQSTCGRHGLMVCGNAHVLITQCIHTVAYPYSCIVSKSFCSNIPNLPLLLRVGEEVSANNC